MVKVDKRLKEKWDNILSREGLPRMDEKEGRIEQEKVPLKGGGGSEQIPESLSSIFEQFSGLSEEFQQGIIDDIQKQRSSGASLPEILERTKLLIQKTQELNEMEQTNSDKTHQSPILQKPVKNIDDFIERMEGLIDRGKTNVTTH